MFTRLAVGTASLLALSFASAVPAGAAPDQGPSFSQGRVLSCAGPVDDGGAPWGAQVAITTDGGVSGVSKAEYRLSGGDHRSGFGMPIGGGVIQAASYQTWLDDELLSSSDRGQIPADERVGCSVRSDSVENWHETFELRYVTAPIRPTYGEIESFCGSDAARAVADDWELANCLPLLSNRAGVTAPATK